MSTYWQTLDEETGLWTAPYGFNNLRINTLVVRLDDARLLVAGPGTNLSDEAFAELDALGEVAALVSPGPFHHMGFPAWKARYPGVRAFAGEKACARITKQHKGVELGMETLDALAAILPDHIVAKDVAGMRQPDLHLVVRDGSGGATWFSNELLQNAPEYPDLLPLKLAYKLTGTPPGLTVNNLFRMIMGGGKGPIGAFFKGELAQHGATCLVPSHGDVLVAEDLGDRLAQVFADTLD